MPIDIKELFTGGERVKRAKKDIKRLEDKPKLSPSNQQSLNEARGVTRRHFLTRTLPSAVAAIGIAGLGIHEAWERLINPNLNRRSDILVPDPEKAALIRHQIREFESANYNNVTNENLSQLANFVAELYGATFGKKPLQRRLAIVQNDFFKEKGMEDETPSAPIGDAGIVYFLVDQNNNLRGIKDIPVLIFSGKPEADDPQINKLSVFRALIMHEFIHTQTKPEFISSEVNVGKTKFQAAYRRGLKWIRSKQNQGTMENEVAHFFEEFNTQLLTEYLNDPTGQDDLFIRMMESPVYRYSLAPNYTWGVSSLKEIYRKLGISIDEVEQFHFNAQPTEFLAKIDRLVAEHGITLSEPASSILIGINSPDPQSQAGLEPLTELAAKIN